ncbi:acetyltransferase (GNAT) family protein [Fontibacillus phaseoli]|uniref:Acetyltransferase (GNAT) family protein n=1 Tax=Fontibacillus phaseoli TaxID=1416533 RepID=A0A369BP81_9BACL|nr:GNAT family N-acetyltransferase [Fontibacillus phaseoli]RCX23422.1 acetyltransferase (GNAT) family protein [Fontibacillus phaseoli]
MIYKINLDEVMLLQKECEAHEDIVLKLNWDTLNSRKEDERMDLAEYRDGKLVAFLGKYDFGSSIEICGMVHPDYRKQGIFTSLLKKGLDAETVSKYSRILLNAPASSPSAKLFLKSAPFVYDFSEYQMKYDKNGDSMKPVRADIRFRGAGPDDVQFLAGMDTDGFGIDAEEAEEYYQTTDPGQIPESEILLLNGTPAGKVRVSTLHGEAWIYGFVVSSGYRGQGIGAAALRQIVERETAAGHEVWLEVALDNPNAMKLYESTGFQVIRAQDYYLYTASKKTAESSAT